MVKKIFVFYFIINLFNYLYANPHKIIVTVNNNPITQIDLDYEMKILSILNNRAISKQQVNIALNNLIEESLKKKEIINEKIKIDDSFIDNHFFQISKNLNLNLNNIDQNLIFLIKEKIKIDKLWNDLIIKKYGWKISINMKEIDQKLKEKYKENYSNEIKNNLILKEKTKKLGVFSRYHLNKLKEQSLIKFYK
jgi:hypothetical protein